MKFCVTCVYWMLLVISVVSSGLLFLIVASESTQVKDHIFLPEKNETFKYDNVTLETVGDEGIELVNKVPGETHSAESDNGEREEQFHQDEATIVSASFETFTSEEGQKEKDLEVLRESITQQPNLSQGISETGQAVVLTLVDTAAAELHSLAKQPKLTQEFRSSRSTTRNSSQSSSVPSTTTGASQQPELPQEVLPTTQIAPPPIVDDTTEKPNDTSLLEDEDVLLHRKIAEEVPDVVVVVRAEQKVATTDDLRLDEETTHGQVLPEEVTKAEDTFTTAPELNDTAARAQLVSGSRDEGAGVILDGLVTGGPSDPHEDIPSFSEWAQKRLEEAEKKKTHPNASVQNPGSGSPTRGAGGMKVRSKNYASPDCGAKVVAANPEARSARSVLVSTRDEYMLNTCTSRVWFVVELCEAIQAKKIELANFELFSSSPKDFSVYVSDRFSARDWSPVGQFTAKDVKDIQSFALHPQLFGKFIKVELHSHYGSEHFCPISLFRAYGTSEFEVLETETENQAAREVTSDAEDDDNDEEELDVEGEAPRNLFGSARDAVLSIVKKAAEVLVKSSDLTGNNITEIQQSIDGGNILENSYDTCTTPRYTILCGNCSDQKFAKVFQLVSCRDRQLDDLLRIEFVNRTLRQGGLCSIHGVEMDSVKKENNRTEEERRTGGELKNLQATFLASVFKPEYIVALCNVLATKERKVVMNTSYEIPGNNSEDTTKREDILSAKTNDESETGSRQTTAPCTAVDSSSSCKSPVKEIKRRSQESNIEDTEETVTTIIETSSSTETLASQIKPTKTLSKEDLKKESSVPILEPSKELTEKTLHAEVITTIPPATNVATPTLKIFEEPSIIGTSLETAPQTITSVPVTTADNNQEASEIVGSDMEGLEMVAGGKVEKIEEDGSKQKELDQEKLSSQDHAIFDTLLSDLKDLEGDGNLQNGPAASVSSTAQPATSSTPQKESVFLRLSNRIKALERNMSLSGQYLEELSRRYKKQVEEMQRSLERAVSAMGEESRKGEERETKRLEEIAALREEIAVLSKSVESLLYDRDSWRSKFSAIGQHAILICLEVVIVIRVLSYCRRANFDDKAKTTKSTKNQTVRRKSAENYNTHVAAKKTKRRRPSEIASHITGTYHELMIEDKSQESKKERKKKRKKELALNSKLSINSETKRETVRYKTVLNVIPGGTSLPSRRASSIDAPNTNDLQPQQTRRPESAPEASIGWFDEQIERKERVVVLEDKGFEGCSEQSSDLSRQMDELSESNSSTNMDRTEGSIEQKNDSAKNSRSGILKGARLSSPSFMKTALGSRRKRKMSNEKWEWESRGTSEKSSQISPTSLKTLSETVNGNAANGLLEDSDESRSSSATPTSGKKEKKSTGLKKMVRKLF